MDVLKWIVNNWDSLLVVIVLLSILILMIKRGETGILKQILFNLVTEAECEYGSGTGELKYAKVADWLYQRIPGPIKILFTAKDIDRLIEAALKTAKETWCDSDIYSAITECNNIAIEECTDEIETVDNDCAEDIDNDCVEDDTDTENDCQSDFGSTEDCEISESETIAVDDSCDKEDTDESSECDCEPYDDGGAGADEECDLDELTEEHSDSSDVVPMG